MNSRMSDKQEGAVTIRVPATANLMIDSADRNNNPAGNQPSPFDFQITRNQSIVNGFFSRIGTTEVVMEWNEPNGAYISSLGGPVNAVIYSNNSTISTFVNIPNSAANSEFYTAESAIDNFNFDINQALQNAGGLASTFSTTVDVVTPGVITIDISPNAQSLFFSTNSYTQALGVASSRVLPSSPLTPGDIFVPITAPDLRPFRYIDFVSQQLTYNQELKDTATALYNRDVLCRWYMDWDQQPQRDGYGLPIEMGYEPFKLRRLFNPPKQIKWDFTQPVGNLSFQLYGNNQPNPIVPATNYGEKGSEWLLTAQISEN